jgi:O-antigen/teichoic acid export membrane protein
VTINKEIKKVLRHSSVYGIGNILHRLPPFILLPLYLNYLTPDDYGKKEIIAISVDFIGIVLSMGIANAMSRFFYDFTEERKQNLVVSTIIIAFSFVSGCLLILIGFFAEPIAELIIDDRTDKYLIIMALASLWFNSLFNISCDYLRIKEQSLLYVVISLIKMIMQLFLNVWFVAFLKWGIYGIFTSTLISGFTFALISVIPLLSKIGFNYSHSMFKRVFAFGGPMVISRLMVAIVNMSDRYFVKAYVGLATAGIYTVGYRLGNSIHYFVQSPFQQIWNPRKFAIHKQPEARFIYAKMLTYYCLIQCMVAVLLICCVKDLLLIIGKPAFLGASYIAPIITVSYVLFGIQDHLNTGILITKKTRYLVFINTANASLNIAMNFLLIPKFGMYGAAWSTLVCMAFKTAITAFYANRLYPILWEYRRLLWILLSASLACTVCFFIDYTDLLNVYLQDYMLNKKLIRFLGIKYAGIHASTGLLIYFVCLSIPGFFTRSEITFIKSQTMKIFAKISNKMAC